MTRPLTVASILAPHRARTVQRMKAHSTVLCIQDGTDLNYWGLAQCVGLGSIGTNQTGPSSAALHLHCTLAVTTQGLPLGLLNAQLHAPVSRADGDKRDSADIPIEEKKTFNWIESLRDCVAQEDLQQPATLSVVPRLPKSNQLSLGPALHRKQPHE